MIEIEFGAYCFGMYVLAVLGLGFFVFKVPGSGFRVGVLVECMPAVWGSSGQKVEGFVEYSWVP